jgi:CheY-like chemotaxis protein
MTTIDPAAPRGRILLVEDDFEAASFVIQVLTVRNGFEVVHTADPGAALRLATSEAWDLVQTDVDRGALPLTVASGADMPRLALDALRGRKVPAHLEFREIAMVRFLEERFIELGEVRRVAA